MTSLKLTFSDIYEKVSDYCGWGSSPSGTDLTNAQALVLRAYRQFLCPIHPRTGRVHVWSFLKKHIDIVLTSTQWKFQLPEDFGSDVYLVHDKDTSYGGLTKLTPQHILKFRRDGEDTDAPGIYAIATSYTKEMGNIKELWFYPTPDSGYILHFGYIIEPVTPTATTDYLVGDSFHSEVILEMALALAEQNEKEELGVKTGWLHTNLAKEKLQTAVLGDVQDVPHTVGSLLRTSVSLTTLENNAELTDTALDAYISS